jgi:Tfp pilus assembly protein PilF
MEKPIYLTEKRFFYNIARVEHRNGNISEQELEVKKKLWEDEYNDPNYETKFKKKYGPRENR